MTKKTRPFSELRNEQLGMPEVASEYLNLAKAQSQEIFKKAVRRVAQARQVSKVAKEAGVQRETLYRAFSEDGNPTLLTFDSVLEALGLGWEIIPLKSEERFGPNALPIDYLDAKPNSIDPQADSRMFVQQLRVIDVGIPRIEKAILDYYRAFEQRSRWAREELLVGDEVESYERRLIDEWERFAAAISDELPPTVSEMELKKVGRQIFNWMEQTADLRIRPNVTEPYVMRGSFHILANKPAPSVWWHPKFLERVSKILTEPALVGFIQSKKQAKK